MAQYTDKYWHSEDGLRLHFRDYAGAGDGKRPPVVCLPGLTRNARDFAALAQHLASPDGGGWRVLCPEMRGRGRSEYAKDSATYTPFHYVRDLLALLDQQGIVRVAIIGTSLGGLMAMILAATAPERLAGVVLNDVGPVLEPGGIAKIAAYVGADPRFASWEAAAEAQKALLGAAFPGRGDASWMASVHRTMIEDADGTIRFDYDPEIAAPFKAAGDAPLPDLWPMFDALGQAGPLLFLRGALSDLLSADSFAQMQSRLPQAMTAVVQGAGHPPALDEHEAAAAITSWLAQVELTQPGQGQ